MELWRTKYSEKYNKKWGRAVREKVVKEVDTFGGKYEEPLIQNRHRLLQRLGICKYLCFNIISFRKRPRQTITVTEAEGRGIITDTKCRAAYFTIIPDQWLG